MFLKLIPLAILKIIPSHVKKVLHQSGESLAAVWHRFCESQAKVLFLYILHNILIYYINPRKSNYWQYISNILPIGIAYYVDNILDIIPGTNDNQKLAIFQLTFHKRTLLVFHNYVLIRNK